MKKLLVFMFSIIMLMGCGDSDSGDGGGGDDGGNGGGNGNLTAGKVMLDTSSNSVSRVYMDSNDNNQYDSGEPLAVNITRGNGYFSYSIDLPNTSKPLKAEVTGSTSGTKNLSAVGGANTYTLSSPAGKMLISPYTTMINNIMVSEGKTLAEAQNAVNASTGKNHDFFSEGTYSNDEVKKTANYIANSIQNAVDNLGGSGLTSEDLNSIIIAVTNAVMEALKDVIAAIIGGSYDEDDKYEPADLDAMALLAQGIYSIDYDDRDDGRYYAIGITGVKIKNGIFSMSEVDVDVYENNRHNYNTNIDLSKMIYDSYGAAMVKDDGSIFVNRTQPIIMDNFDVKGNLANATLKSMVNADEQISDSTFPRLVRPISFSSNAQSISFDWISSPVDLDNQTVRNSLDLDNSPDKEIAWDQPWCYCAKTEDIITVYNNGSCSTDADSWKLYQIGGKARVALTYSKYDNIYVIWIENGRTYGVSFDINAGARRMTLYNKAAVDEFLRIYFSE